MREIAGLSDHPHFIPALVAGIEAQWPDWAAAPPGQALRGFESPLDHWLVAFDGDTALGTVSLREHTEPDFAILKPALGSLWVHPDHRGAGIGTALVEAGMRLAKSQNEPMLYAFTINAAGLLKRLGWEQVDTVIHEGEEIGAYGVALDNAHI